MRTRTVFGGGSGASSFMPTRKNYASKAAKKTAMKTAMVDYSKPYSSGYDDDQLTSFTEKRKHRRAFGGAKNVWTETLIRNNSTKRRELRDSIRFYKEIHSQHSDDDGDDSEDSACEKFITHGRDSNSIQNLEAKLKFMQLNESDRQVIGVGNEHQATRFPQYMADKISWGFSFADAEKFKLKATQVWDPTKNPLATTEKFLEEAVEQIKSRMGDIGLNANDLALVIPPEEDMLKLYTATPISTTAASQSQKPPTGDGV